MLLLEFRKIFTSKLENLFPTTEIDTFFFLLIEEYLNLQRVDIVLTPSYKITESDLTLFKDALKRLQKEEPIQYILGETEFYGLPFFVDKNTLIPRPETEELVNWVFNDVTKSQGNKVANSSTNDKHLTILDIGTGSGCIAISLAKKLPNAKITAIDVSEEALTIAKRNAKLNAVEIEFLQANILETKKLLKQFDIIVSNPPYVRELEKKEIKPNVLENEPHLALFVADNDPLIFYSKIADLAKSHLTENGCLYFEINQYLGKETVDMLIQKGYINTELKKDLFGNDRMTKSSI